MKLTSCCCWSWWRGAQCRGLKKGLVQVVLEATGAVAGGVTIIPGNFRMEGGVVMQFTIINSIHYTSISNTSLFYLFLHFKIQFKPSHYYHNHNCVDDKMRYIAPSFHKITDLPSLLFLLVTSNHIYN